LSGIHAVQSGLPGKFCAECFDLVYWSERAQAWFHAPPGDYSTIARNVTSKPLHAPLRPVKPLPDKVTFTVPKYDTIDGTIRDIRIL
jgi:hypothetical protein